MLFTPFFNRSLFFDKGPDGAGVDDAGGTDDEKKTYTQTELNTMFAERQQRGPQAAISDLLKKVGLDTVDNLVAIVAEGQKLKQSQMTELEKINNDLSIPSMGTEVSIKPSN